MMVKIVVTNVKKMSGCTEVVWQLNGSEQVSHFYRHGDGSLGFDPYFVRHSLAVQAVVYALANDASLSRKGKKTAVLSA
ncbi:MAG: hypothetical protein SOI44_06685 [Lactimicrobium sp.]|uniref:hypothetical protein n=1 Tax=Lactimicrobium sp. TaxID=2563780 RepID=UPI002F35E4C9